MSTDHNWDVRTLAGYLSVDEYDVDTTSQSVGRLCTCRQCSLRVIVEADRMPGDVQGIPACRPPTYQTAEHLQAEQLLLAAEAMCCPEHLATEPEPEPVPESCRVAAGQVAVALAAWLPAWLTRNARSHVSSAWWNGRKKERLLLLMLLEHYVAEFERGGDWNWDHYDDHDFDGDDRFHPEEMQSRLRELQARISESIMAAEVMES